MTSIGFVNAKGDVGKTTLIYHLASMFSELGVRVLAIDLDPQANLTELCLGYDRVPDLWSESPHRTILGAVEPVMAGKSEIRSPSIIEIDPRFGLLAGDLELSALDGVLDHAWHHISNHQLEACFQMAAFWKASMVAAQEWQAEIILIDLAPSLGPLTRAALIAAEHLVLPLPSHAISLQALRVLGSVIRGWRDEWRDRYTENMNSEVALPAGKMAVLGYVLLQHALRFDSTVLVSGRALARIPDAFRTCMMPEHSEHSLTVIDPFCLATLRDYRSLLPLSIEARKPMFLLRPGDGAFEAEQEAVRRCYDDFRSLALRISEKLTIKVPLIEGTAS